MIQTNEEYRQLLGYMVKSEESTQLVNDTYLANEWAIPLEVDWRVKRIVTPIKDQLECYASSWSFSAIASLEGQYSLATGDLIGLVSHI